MILLQDNLWREVARSAAERRQFLFRALDAEAEINDLDVLILVV